MGVAGGHAAPVLEAVAAPFPGVARRVPCRGVGLGAGASAPGRNGGLAGAWPPPRADSSGAARRPDRTVGPAAAERVPLPVRGRPPMPRGARPRHSAPHSMEAEALGIGHRGPSVRRRVQERISGRTTAGAQDVPSIATLPAWYAGAGFLRSARARRDGGLPSPVRRPSR